MTSQQHRLAKNKVGHFIFMLYITHMWKAIVTHRQ